MKRFSTFHATPNLVMFSLIFGLLIAPAFAQPMHTPTKMPMAEAESVGMSTEGLSRIDEMMQEHIDAGHIQGGATIVARRGKVVHFSTHGEMDVEKGRVMERDAIYIMASSAKPVIAVATLMLVDEGLISLDDPISKYIPEFADLKVAVPIETADGKAGAKSAKAKGKEEAKGKEKAKSKGKDEEWTQEEIDAWLAENQLGSGKGDKSKYRHVPLETPLTIHHLLTHTSGLTGGDVQRAEGESFASYVPKLAEAPLNFQPGTRWVYGNVGIHSVLPRIIEIASGAPFYEFMRERLFNPLEMNNTYFHVPSDKASKRVVLKGYDVSKKGGGGLVSAAEDFLHFEQMLLNGGELFGHRVLRPETVKMMSTNQVGDLFSTAGKGEKAQKGMGFGYAVAVTLDPVAAANDRGKGAFGWGGAAGTVSWTDPENELVGVLMLQQPRGGGNFGKAVQQAIIE
jgi:CubicO group peptidase (beta-lactamase class C family)